MKRFILVLLFTVFLFFSMVLPAAEAKHYVTVPCTVLKVIDGDTIDVAIPSYAEVNEKEHLRDSPDSGKHKGERNMKGGALYPIETVRLEEVNCPELNESKGPDAKEFTEKFLSGGNVSIRIYIVDGTEWGKYAKHGDCGRLLGDLLVDGKSLNSALQSAELCK